MNTTKNNLQSAKISHGVKIGKAIIASLVLATASQAGAITLGLNGKMTSGGDWNNTTGAKHKSSEGVSELPTLEERLKNKKSYSLSFIQEKYGKYLNKQGTELSAINSSFIEYFWKIQTLPDNVNFYSFLQETFILGKNVGLSNEQTTLLLQAYIFLDYWPYNNVHLLDFGNANHPTTYWDYIQKNDLKKIFVIGDNNQVLSKKIGEVLVRFKNGEKLGEKDFKLLGK